MTRQNIIDLSEPHLFRTLKLPSVESMGDGSLIPLMCYMAYKPRRSTAELSMGLCMRKGIILKGRIANI